MMNTYRELSDQEKEDRENRLYAEKETRLLYEASFLDDCVLVRPASPYSYSKIEKMSFDDFSRLFDEFGGDHVKVKAYIKRAIDDLDAQYIG